MYEISDCFFAMWYTIVTHTASIATTVHKITSIANNDMCEYIFSLLSFGIF